MGFLKVVFLFLFFKFFVCDFTENLSLVKPCMVHDVECVKNTTKLFLESTSSGIPHLAIKPIDPLLLPTMNVQGGKDLTLHYKNVTIYGLKGMKLEYYRVDAAAKFVFMLTTQDLTIKSDLVVEQTDKLQTVRGTMTAKGSTICTIKYNYDLVKDIIGVEHFDVGPENIYCHVTEDPRVTLSEDLKQALSPEKCRTAVKKMTEEAFAHFVHNIRTSAKLLPIKAFFTNI